MPKGDNLGEFELLNLTAVLMLGDEAYGMLIHEQVEKLTNKRLVSLGSVYATLERLQNKGYLSSNYADPTPERGGRAKRYFAITGAGQLALKEAMKVADNMLTGLREIGGLV